MAIDFLGSTSTIDESEKLKYLEQVLALTLNKPDVAAAVGEAIGGIINENDQIETSFLIWKQEGADDVEEPVAKRCRLEGIFRQQQVAPQPESSQEDEMEITPRK